jgi:hypothetical protein
MPAAVDRPTLLFAEPAGATSRMRVESQWLTTI